MVCRCFVLELTCYTLPVQFNSDLHQRSRTLFLIANIRYSCSTTFLLSVVYSNGRYRRRGWGPFVVNSVLAQTVDCCRHRYLITLSPIPPPLFSTPSKRLFLKGISVYQQFWNEGDFLKKSWKPLSGKIGKIHKAVWILSSISTFPFAVFISRLRMNCIKFHEYHHFLSVLW